MEIKTLCNLFDSLITIYGDNPMMKFRNNKGEWTGLNTKEVLEYTYKVAMGLDSLGLVKGDKICLMSHTRYEWSIIDFAIEIMGMVNVPIYPTLTSDQIKFIATDSEAKLFISSDMSSLNKINNRKELTEIKKFIVIEKDKSYDSYEGENKDIVFLKDLLKKGENLFKEKGIEYIKNISNGIIENDLASILYTSGTTGVPKGVMLSHKNIISNAKGAAEKLELYKYNHTIVFLPLSHSFARTCTYAIMIGGITLWYAESVDTLGRDMLEVKPEVMIVVPRVFEKVYERVIEAANKSGKIKQIIFKWAKKVAEDVAIKKDMRKKVPPLLNFSYKIADKLVYKSIRDKTGGRIIFAVSGSSSLAKHIAYFFYGIGIPILEGYGLTEASPVISTNTLNKNKINTVGTPFSGVEIKTNNDGELLVKGDNVMMGYYRNEEATKEVITEDGWLKTGDICEIDDENYIKIVDRKKDMLKTSGGKYIIPQKIENLAKTDPVIEEFVVIAENRRFASAIIFPNFAKLKEFASQNNIIYKDEEELIKNYQVIELFQKIIDNKININLARYETIKKFILVSKPFTIESGELTPTLKVKRKAISIHYAEKIEKLYED